MATLEAAVGAVFGELLRRVLEIKDKADMFKETLANLESTLVEIAPVIKEIEQHNKELGRPKELQSLIRQMEKGTKLVFKCSQIHKLNFIAKGKYQHKLQALNDSLVKFFGVDMQAHSARDQKETLIKVRRIFSAVNKLTIDPDPSKVGASSSSNSLPEEVSKSEYHMETANTSLLYNSVNQSDHTPVSTLPAQQINASWTNSTYYQSKDFIYSSFEQLNIQATSSKPDSTRSNAQSNSIGSSTINNHTSSTNSSKPEDSEIEWTEAIEPGVHITFISLPGAAIGIKKVTFSRSRFSEEEKEQWWVENKDILLAHLDDSFYGNSYPLLFDSIE